MHRTGPAVSFLSVECGPVPARPLSIAGVTGTLSGGNRVVTGLALPILRPRGPRPPEACAEPVTGPVTVR